MIPSAPQTVRNNFYDELKLIADENKFESVRRYYDSFSRAGSGRGLSVLNDPEVQKKVVANPQELGNILNEAQRYKNIDPRVDAAKFFYFPTESSPTRMNCLEKSACMYFALQELYPQSNPALTYVMFPNGSMHATTLFTHKKKLHAADPNFHIYGEVELTDKELIIKEEPGKEDRKHEYSDIFKVGDNVLNQLALKLRSDRGIVDFVYGSGQLTGWGGYDTVTQLFTYVDGEKIISEIRGGTQGVRFTNGENSEVSLIGYEKFWWRGITGEKQLAMPETSPFLTCSLEEKVRNFFPFSGLAHFVQNPRRYIFTPEKKQRFLADSLVQRRFEKSFQDSQHYSEATRDRFVDFLMHKFGEDPAQIVPLQENIIVKLMNVNTGGVIDFNFPLSDYSFEAMHLKEVLDMIQMTHDAKKYNLEIKKQMTGKESEIIV